MADFDTGTSAESSAGRGGRSARERAEDLLRCRCLDLQVLVAQVGLRTNTLDG